LIIKLFNLLGFSLYNRKYFSIYQEFCPKIQSHSALAITIPKTERKMSKSKKNTPCPVCADKKVIVCPKCNGTGIMKSMYYNLTTVADKEISETCILCDGAGKIDCPKCSS
jgi:hypothetical protein